MSFIGLDSVGSSQSNQSTIKIDTLIEILDQDQLSRCLKQMTLNVDDSLHILDKVQSKYKLPDRLKAICNISTDFGKGDNVDSEKLVKFTRALWQCLQLGILDYIANIIETAFFKIGQLSDQLNQNSQTFQIPKPQRHPVNKSIEELKKISKTEENFDNI